MAVNPVPDEFDDAPNGEFDDVPNGAFGGESGGAFDAAGEAVAGDAPTVVSPLLSGEDGERLARQAPFLSRAADEFTALARTLPGDASVDANDALAIVKGVEDVQRRLAFLKLVALRAFMSQSDPHAYGVRTPAGVLTRSLSISRFEARRLVGLAQDLTPGVGLTGAPVPVRLPEVAAGLRDGELSLDQAQAMIREVDKLPRRFKAAHERAMEHLLVAHGKSVEVEHIRVLGKRCRDWIDPDGSLDKHDREDRSLRLFQRKDGFWKLDALLTPEVGLALYTSTTDRGRADGAAGVVAASGAPVEVDLPEDVRPDAVRRHDRFAQIVLRGVQAGPGGAGFALVVTATAEQVAAGRGEVEAAGGHCRLEDVLAMSPGGKFVYFSRQPGSRKAEVRTVNRFANANQMTLLRARDRGCSFPGCDMPVGWCEAHHMVPWSQGGPTDIANLTLLCGYHHHWHDKHGWTARLIDGIPGWIPPKTIDRKQRPLFHSRFQAERIDLSGLDEPPPLFVVDETESRQTNGAGQELNDEERWGTPPDWPDGVSTAGEPPDWGDQPDEPPF